MIRIRTPSRLHFGLFSFDHGPRKFGGVGAMIDQPGIELTLSPSASLQADGLLADRALEFARAWARGVGRGEDEIKFRLRVEHAGPQHSGLGTGTQLAMAIATALGQALGDAEEEAAALARSVGRGERSAVGLHGFQHGGMIVEGGKKELGQVSPMLARVALPEAWRFVLAIPRTVSAGISGMRERQLFSYLPPVPDDVTARLCQLTLTGLLPAAIEHDCAAFSAALHELNLRVGESFAPAQGDVYAHPQLAAIVRFVRGQGVPGVGQSSWGPTIFAVVDEESKAITLAQAIRSSFHLSDDEVLVARPNNSGATVMTE